MTALQLIAQLLKDTIGLDPVSIGLSAIERAVVERQRTCGLNDDLAYWEHLRSSGTELQTLVETVVVPETWFFRDGDSFGVLARAVYENSMSCASDGVVRILSLPCSSGEEPYSIAMALLDAGVHPARFVIDAVDVSERLLGIARRATYGRNSFRGTDVSFRNRHFRPTAGGYVISDDVRRQIQFAQGNLFSLPPRSGRDLYDAVFCRNLLIYFDRATQDRAVLVLRRLLSAKGLLFVGASETGVLANHDLRSLEVPKTFGFRPAAAVPAEPRSNRRRARRVPAPPASVPLFPPATGAAAASATEKPAATLSDVLDEARTLADQGQFVEAAMRCQECLRTYGPSADVFYLLGLVRDASGSRSEADMYYRKAIYLDPNHAEALIHLALLLDSHGRAAEALVLRNRVRRLQVTSKA